MLISLLFHGRFSPYGHRAPCAEGCADQRGEEHLDHAAESCLSQLV